MRISDWSSDVCSSDLLAARAGRGNLRGVRVRDRLRRAARLAIDGGGESRAPGHETQNEGDVRYWPSRKAATTGRTNIGGRSTASGCTRACMRSEEHTSELQSLIRISNAVFCLQET